MKEIKSPFDYHNITCHTQDSLINTKITHQKFKKKEDIFMKKNNNLTVQKCAGYNLNYVIKVNKTSDALRRYITSGILPKNMYPRSHYEKTSNKSKLGIFYKITDQYPSKWHGHDGQRKTWLEET